MIAVALTLYLVGLIPSGFVCSLSDEAPLWKLAAALLWPVTAIIVLAAGIVSEVSERAKLKAYK